MKYLSNLNISQANPSVVTLGNFDGIHLGHRKLIETVKMIGKEKDYQSVVFSFYPHPQIVLKSNPIGMIFQDMKEKQIRGDWDDHT